jgi:hypothetical protein
VSKNQDINMSDSKDKDPNKDLENLDNLDSITELGEEEKWDSELEDNYDDSSGNDDDDDDDDIVEFEEDDSSDEDSSDEKSKSVKKSKSGKKSIIPLALAGTFALGMAGFVVVSNTGVLSDPNPVSVAVASVNKNTVDKTPVLVETGNFAKTPVFEDPVIEDPVIDIVANNIMPEKQDFDLSNNITTQIIDFNIDGENLNKDESAFVINNTPFIEGAIDQPSEISVSDSNTGVQLLPESVNNSGENHVVVNNKHQNVESLTLSESSNSVKNSELISLLTAMSGELNDLKGQVGSLNSEINTFKEDNVVDGNIVERISNAEKFMITSGRERLKGFRVINTSEDGLMSIVEIYKKPYNRISVFFKGEKIILKGKGVFSIRSIHDSGYLALVNDKWYIDDILDPIIEFEKPKLKPVPKKPIENKNNKKDNVTITSTIKDNSDVVIVRAAKKDDRVYQIAEGWLLNAIYNEQFLLQTPSGKWVTKTTGDKLEHLGLVNGLNKEGDLIVGEYLIKLAEN